MESRVRAIAGAATAALLVLSGCAPPEQPPPAITDVEGAVEHHTVTVSADVERSQQVTARYRVNFADEAEAPMFDDGAHGDGAPGDGRWAGNLPDAEPGDLVRYAVHARGAGEVRMPSDEEDARYHGLVIPDEDSGDPELLRWFIDDEDLDDMVTNHLTDDEEFPAVVAVGDRVFDGATIRVKGTSTTANAKRKYKIELADGQHLGAPYFEHPVDEFALNANMHTLYFVNEWISMNVLDEFGLASLQTHPIRVLRKAGDRATEPQGVYLLLEGYDKGWRERTGHATGALYKEGPGGKKTRLHEDNSDILGFLDAIDTLEGESLHDYLADQVDLDPVVDFHAVLSVLRKVDWGVRHNSFLYRDTEGTGRWKYLPWDLDGSLIPTYMVYGADWDFRAPDHLHPDRPIERAMYQFDHFRERYEHRLAEVFDALYGSGERIEQLGHQMLDDHRGRIEEDLDLWRSERVAWGAALDDAGIFMPPEMPGGFASMEALQGALDVDLIHDLLDYDSDRMRDTWQAWVASGG